jgi:hypothetical protein
MAPKNVAGGARWCQRVPHAGARQEKVEQESRRRGNGKSEEGRVKGERGGGEGDDE